MKRMLRLLPLVLLCAIRVEAQSIVCHGCPDRIVYASPAAWTQPSKQCHWSAKGANSTGDRPDPVGFNPKGTVLDPAHVHMDMVWPSYGEINSPQVIPFTIKLRQLAGQLVVWGASPFKPLDHNDDATDWWWDATQSSLAPPLIWEAAKADAMGVQNFTGHFTMHPRTGFHGWDRFEMSGTVFFDNGDTLIMEAVESYWTGLDGTPITPAPGGQGEEKVPQTGVHCAPIANGSQDAFGDNLVAVDDYLPTAPVTGLWRNTLGLVSQCNLTGGHGGFGVCTNSYGGSSLLHTDGSYQQRHGQNFHMGIAGITDSLVSAPGIINGPMLLDTTTWPVGITPVALIRYQPEDHIPENGVASLIVFNVTRGDGTPPIEPPPLVCTPPATPVNGVCVTPPPPVLPTIVNVTTCMNVTFSDGVVTSDCMHRP